MVGRVGAVAGRPRPAVLLLSLLLLVVVEVGPGQAGGGSARSAARAARKSCAQGQRAGIRSVVCAAGRARRPGIVSSRRRSVRAARIGVVGQRDAAWVQRSRLCASAAITVQAALAVELDRTGSAPSAWSLRSRIASSTTACWRCSASTSSSASVRLVKNAKCRQSGHSSAWSPSSRVRRTIRRCCAEHRLRDLRLAVVGVVLKRLPVLLGDRRDRGRDVLLLAHPDRVGPARAPAGGAMIFLFQNPESARSSFGPLAPARATRGMSSSTNRSAPARGVRRALAGTDVQHLAGLARAWRGSGGSRACGCSRTRRPACRSRGPHRRTNRRRRPAAPSPGPAPAAHARARLSREHPVELADVPERERAQERPQRRRRRDAMPEHRRGLPRPQHVAVLDAVRARAPSPTSIVITLRPGFAAPGRSPRSTRCIDQPLDPQPPCQQRRQHHARVRDRPLIIEHHDRRLVHHEGDLLSRAATAAICRYKALLGRSLHPTPRMERWIEA